MSDRGVEPYLEGEARILFDAWHGQVRRRYEQDLTAAEIRKGVQALSSLYVGGRRRLASASGPFDGAGKRAAFVLYYAPLHFLVAYHVAREIGFDAVPFGRLWDLGCGAGAAGAAWAVAAHARPQAEGADGRLRSVKVIGVDRSGFALEEAAATYRAFGVAASTNRIDLGRPAPHRAIAARASGGRVDPGRIRKDDAVVLAYTVNEMDGPSRDDLLRRLAVGSGTSRPLMILEPIARTVAPWWSRWEHALGEEALLVHSFEWRKRLALPVWIAEMDRAAGLDHRELTARVLGVVG